jgi:acetyl-CoA C-acetyltransferase
MSSIEVEENRVARSAFISGWAHSPFGKLEDPDTEGLMARVLGPALDHAQIAAEDVDGVFVGIMNNGFKSRISRAPSQG